MLNKAGSGKSVKKGEPASGYSGRRTKTGNSAGFRFEAALFKSHPEFAGEVRAHVIAPGRMLVMAEAVEQPKGDPVISSFLAFLSRDMVERPQSIRTLDERRVDEIAALVKGTVVDMHEDFGDEDLI